MSYTNPYAGLPEPIVPPSYSAEQLDEMARTGTKAQRLTVASRHNCPSSALDWLMSNDRSEEIKREIISRSDVTPKRLVRAATTSEDVKTLGRIAGHPKTPLASVRMIQERG